MSGDDTTTTETTTDDLDDLKATEVDTDTGEGDTGDEGKGETRSQRRHQRDRERADAAEARAAELAGRVEAFQRREVERIAGGVLAQAEDLFTVGGVTLADVIGEDGEIDETEVLAMCAALVDSRPGLMRGATPPRGHVNWGHSTAGTTGIGDSGPTWDDALEVRPL